MTRTALLVIVYLDILDYIAILRLVNYVAHTHTHTHTHTYIYIYIYIYRERERLINKM